MIEGSDTAFFSDTAASLAGFRAPFHRLLIADVALARSSSLVILVQWQTQTRAH